MSVEEQIGRLAASVNDYMSVDIDANGHLIYERADTVDVDFNLRDGDLIVEEV